MLTPGTRIDDRYEIVAMLGSGGMGHVYRARRLHLGDEVAIKVMQATHESAPELRERFLRESRACAQLRHPNIVSLLDFGFDAGRQPYMVMELLSGPSLREEIQLEAPMTAARVASILRFASTCETRPLCAAAVTFTSVACLKSGGKRSIGLDPARF